MRNLKKINFIFLLTIVWSFMFSGQAMAASVGPEEVKLKNPINIGTDVRVVIGTVIKGLMGVMGALALLMVVWGAGTWLLSAGNPEKVKAGSQTMLWAVLGVVITVASYMILTNIMNLITINK